MSHVSNFSRAARSALNTGRPKKARLFRLWGDSDTPWQLVPVGFTATERLNSPFEVLLELQPTKPATFDFDLYAAALLGKSLGLAVLPSQHAGDKERFFHGEVAGVYLNEVAGQRHGSNVVVELRPALWKLSLSTDTRYFTGLTTKEIVTAILEEQGLSGQYTWHAAAQESSQKHEHCWQLQETHLQFVQRLLEHEGYQYWYTFDETGHQLHLAAGPEALPKDLLQPLPLGKIGPQADRSGRVAYLRRSYQAVPANCSVHGRSADGLHAVSNSSAWPQIGAAGTLAEYDNGAHTVTECKRSAERRLKQCAANSRSFEGMSDIRRISAGGVVIIESVVLSQRMPELRVLAVRHEATLKTGSYSNRFELLPHDGPFSPLRRLAKPHMEGPSGATVVAGPNDQGHYRLKFDLDRNAKISGWVPWSPDTDIYNLPRKGQRVKVDFLQGDPGRPMIQRLLEPAARWPFDPQENPQLGGIVTPLHELLLQSDPKDPWIKLNSSGDIQELAAGNYDLSTGKDLDESIAGDRQSSIGKDARWSVGGNWLAEIVQELSIDAKTIVLSAKQQIVFQVGKSFISIDANGITLNGKPLLQLNPPGASAPAKPAAVKKSAKRKTRAANAKKKKK
jgi:type VI secretion system secreted protein VgrG